MLYIFQDNILTATSTEWLQAFPLPDNSHIYVSIPKRWYYKGTRAGARLIPDDMVPKELKMQLLLLDVPL